MITVTAVHMVGGVLHEHIASVQWRNTATNASGQSTRKEMVEFIEKGNEAYVSTYAGTVPIGVVNGNPKYIRTYTDGKWADNLLALPKY